MLTNEIVKKIEDFVSKQPRSVQEVAEKFKISWRTADRYVEEIKKEYSTIETKVFRGGTRGALKIVFWNSTDKINNNVYQEELEKEILEEKKKEDFQAFDIFQHIEDKNKKAIIEYGIKEESFNLLEFSEMLLNTKKQLLIFSGNLSFINLNNKTINMLKILESLIKKGVSIKIICRIDVAGIDNVQKLLSLNYKLGKELIEIKHREQPLRAFIIDNEMFRMKEVKEATGRIYELDKRLYIFYTIKDKEWTNWLSKIFWKMYSKSIGVEKRLKELDKLKFSVTSK